MNKHLEVFLVAFQEKTPFIKIRRNNTKSEYIGYGGYIYDTFGTPNNSKNVFETTGLLQCEKRM